MKLPLNFHEAVINIKKFLSKNIQPIGMIIDFILDETKSQNSMLKVIEFLRILSENKDEHARIACTMLALFHLEGVVIAQNIPIAISLLKKAIKRDCPLAKYHLAKYYLLQNSVKIRKEGICLLMQACTQEFVPAQHYLGHIYVFDKSGYKRKEGIKLLESASEKDYWAAHFDLGCCFERNLVDGKNINDALQKFHLAARNSFAAAEFKLGIYYFKGIGLEPNIMLAIDWLIKAYHHYNAISYYLIYPHASEESRILNLIDTIVKQQYARPIKVRLDESSLKIIAENLLQTKIPLSTTKILQEWLGNFFEKQKELCRAQSYYQHAGIMNKVTYLSSIPEIEHSVTGFFTSYKIPINRGLAQIITEYAIKTEEEHRKIERRMQVRSYAIERRLYSESLASYSREKFMHF